MTGALYSALGPLFRALGAERSHRLAIAALKMGVFPGAGDDDDPRLAMGAFGFDFPNPVGLAAGFDKNGEVPAAILRAGFGFTEIGTATPLPQTGNPRPRLFRLNEDHGVINRMGFNNDGFDRIFERLARNSPGHGIIGVNIGANRDSDDRIADYVLGVKRFHAVADYLVINISSPNTPGLRGLQDKSALVTLIERILAARAESAQGPAHATPILLKLSPDLDAKALEDIAEICVNAKLDGVILTNTTLARDNVSGEHAGETGGLSGSPLFVRSTARLAQFYKLTSGKLPLIGVGGIDSADTAYMKIKAGASLLQVYSGLVFEGPGLIRGIKRELPGLLSTDGHGTLADAVGSEADEMARLEDL